MKDGSRIIHFIDTETTGLDHRRHEVISVGILEVKEVRTGERLDYEVIAEHEVKIKPERLDTADPIAFKINKFKPEDWADALTGQGAFEILGPILERPDANDPKINDVSVAGHQVHFDVLMLAAFFARFGVTWNPRHALDTYTLSRKVLRGDIVLESYALRSLCEYYDIENEKAHTALSDARACYELYKKLMNA